jgi:hypothetical protein
MTRYNQYGGEGQRAVGGVEAGPPLQTDFKLAIIFSILHPGSAPTYLGSSEDVV